MSNRSGSTVAEPSLLDISHHVRNIKRFSTTFSPLSLTPLFDYKMLPSVSEQGV